MIQQLVYVLIQKEIPDESHREENEYVLTVKFENLTAHVIFFAELLFRKRLQGMICILCFAPDRR